MTHEDRTVIVHIYMLSHPALHTIEDVIDHPARAVFRPALWFMNPKSATTQHGLIGYVAPQ